MGFQLLVNGRENTRPITNSPNPATSQGHAAWQFHLNIKGSALFGAYHVDDSIASWMDAESLNSLHFEERLYEGGRHTSRTYDFCTILRSERKSRRNQGSSKGHHRRSCRSILHDRAAADHQDLRTLFAERSRRALAVGRRPPRTHANENSICKDRVAGVATEEGNLQLSSAAVTSTR